MLTKKTSIERKLRNKMILLVSVPVVTISVLCTIVAMIALQQMSIDNIQTNLTVISTEADRIFDEALALAETVESNAAVHNTLSTNRSTDSISFYRNTMALETILYSIYQPHSDHIFSFYVVDQQNHAYKSTFHSLNQADYTHTHWYQKIIESDEPVWFSPHAGSFVVTTTDASLVSLGIPITDRKTGDSIGVVVVDIALSTLEHVMTYTQDTLPGEVVLVDKDNMILSGNANIFTENNIDTNTLDFTAPDDEHLRLWSPFMLHANSEIVPWRFVSVVPSNKLQPLNTMLFGVNFILIFCSSIFTVFYLRHTSKEIFRPLKSIEKRMEELQRGNFSEKIPVQTMDEIGVLIDGFNRMTTQISNLMDEVIKEEQKIRHLEIKALQAQINPHFLYNTLDNVNWMAREGDTDNIIQVIQALTSFFRVSLSAGKDVISIAAEKTHAENYLKIEKYRYGDKLSYEIHIPPTIERYAITKLTLQPIIENAIAHGIKPLSGNGLLTIEAKEAEAHIHFTIQDNGCGIQPHILEKLNHSAPKDIPSTSSGYGIKNVRERLTLMFGESHTIQFHSQLGQGTTVHLTIPKTTEEAFHATSNHSRR